MTDVPILFSAPMIQALLAGRKTQTRRLAWRGVGRPAKWQRVCPGDRLWVRETWAIRDCGRSAGLSAAHWPQGWPVGRLRYKADHSGQLFGARSPIHMPRWASRLTLTVTAARVERLRAISEDDAVAEGCFRIGAALARGMFRDLWGQLHGAGAWRQNPQVVVLTFAVARVNIIDAYGEAP